MSYIILLPAAGALMMAAWVALIALYVKVTR